MNKPGRVFASLVMTLLYARIGTAFPGLPLNESGACAVDRDGAGGGGWRRKHPVAPTTSAATASDRTKKFIAIGTSRLARYFAEGASVTDMPIA